MDMREGRACRGRTTSASVPPSDATSASLPFRISSVSPRAPCDRPEARSRPMASRAEVARVQRVPGVCGDIRMNLINEIDVNE